MRSPTSRLSTILCLLLLCSVSAGAQNRTWVSGVGDDANPGTRTAPCKTFLGVMSRTNANGEIDALDPGDFRQVTITKSVTIDSSGNFAGIQSYGAGMNGIVINAGPTDVINLRRLSLQGSGLSPTGIRIIGSGAVTIENCYISGWTTAIDISQATAANIAVSNCQINGSTTGVKVSMPAGGSRVSLDSVRITGCTNATDLLAGNLDVSNSLLSQNSGNGLFAEGGVLNSFNNVLAANGKDVAFTFGSVRTFNNSGPVSLSVSQNTTVQNVGAGQPAVFALTVTPPPGGFPSVVNFSSSGLPAGLTATFNPSSLPAGSGATPVTLTIAATASKAAVLSGESDAMPGGPAAGVVLATVAFLVLMLAGTRHPRFATLMPVAVLTLLLVTAGCGGGSGGTNASGGVVANSTVPSAASPTPTSAGAASPSPTASVAASQSPSVAASPSPGVSPSPAASPSPTPIVGKFPFTVTITSGGSSVSQTYAVNLQ